MVAQNYMLALHGDLLEKQASQFIVHHIPGYQDIWQRYIGHDQCGNMARLINASADDEEFRVHFAQHHYTILESTFFMQKIADDYSEASAVATFEDFRRVINDIMAFQAYSGRLRDNLEKCGEMIAGKKFALSLIQGFSSLYSQRHVFIHGCKIPFVIDGGVFKMPMPKRNADSRDGYGQNEPWYTISSSDMVKVGAFLSEVMVELLPKVNSSLFLLLPKVKELIQAKQLSLEPPGNIFLPDEGCPSAPDPQEPITFIGGSGMPHDY